MTRRPPARPLIALLLVAGAACGDATTAGSGSDTATVREERLPLELTTTAPPTTARPTTARPTTIATATTQPAPAPASTTASTVSTATTVPASPTTVLPPPTSAPPPPRTACTRVLHIGDSTTVGAISAEYVAEPRHRLDAQYRRVGATDVSIDASPGRSIVERLAGAPSAHDVAIAARGRGYRGCWVVAIGTNDAANIGAGANLGAAARIDRIMEAVDGDPVLWVDAVTFTDEGAWAQANMAAWNVALRDAVGRHPNLRVYEWSRVAHADWFTSDGVHDNSTGAAYRAALLADALAAAFPDD
jgi:hypothetical protein